MEGNLKKWTNMITRWKTRFVKVEKDVLTYFSKSHHSLKGTYLLNNSTLITDSNKSENFILKTSSGEMVYFLAPSIEVKQKWVKAFEIGGSKIAINETKPIISDILGVENFRNNIISILKSKLLNSNTNINKIINYSQESLNLLDEYLNNLITLSEKTYNFEITSLTKKIVEVAINLKSTVFDSNAEIEDAKADIVKAGQVLVSEAEKFICQENSSKIGCLNLDNGKSIDEEKESPYSDQIKEIEVQESNRFYEDVFVDALDTSLTKNEDYLSDSQEPIERTCLPVKKDPNAKVSLWTVLKDIIGKDLTHFALPVYFNEPISMIQRTAEVFESDYLLDKASYEKNSLSRLLYLSIFVISQFQNVVHRTTKPFNPVLGETYEIINERYRLFGEQVSHHPPVSALHIENDNYKVETDTQVSTKFWGKSLEFKPIGFQRIYLKKSDEHYIVQRPTPLASNIIIGKMYLDVGGESVVENIKTKEKAYIFFKTKGWTEASYGKCEGYIKDSKGTKKYILKGKWFDSITVTDLETNESFIAWRSKERQKDSQFYFFFSNFTLQLNYLTDKLKKLLPPTDSRMRPDQRALENGDIKLAASEKVRIEEKQRAARKELEQKHLKYKPIYFDEEVTSSGLKMYNFNLDFLYLSNIGN